MRHLRIAHCCLWLPDQEEVILAPMVQQQFFLQELSLLLQASGLELMARYGDFAPTPLEPWSLN